MCGIPRVNSCLGASCNAGACGQLVVEAAAAAGGGCSRESTRVRAPLGLGQACVSSYALSPTHLNAIIVMCDRFCAGH
jgi:hypothetical protein